MIRPNAEIFTMDSIHYDIVSDIQDSIGILQELESCFENWTSILETSREYFATDTRFMPKFLTVVSKLTNLSDTIDTIRNHVDDFLEEFNFESVAFMKIDINDFLPSDQNKVFDLLKQFYLYRSSTSHTDDAVQDHLILLYDKILFLKSRKEITVCSDLLHYESPQQRMFNIEEVIATSKCWTLCGSLLKSDTVDKVYKQQMKYAEVNYGNDAKNNRLYALTSILRIELQNAYRDEGMAYENMEELTELMHSIYRELDVERPLTTDEASEYIRNLHLDTTAHDYSLKNIVTDETKYSHHFLIPNDTDPDDEKYSRPDTDDATIERKW